jgi:hypothetical protein
MIWSGRVDEAGALGLLLDRTYAEVAAAAQRPRLLDREFLIGQFDLWDNHLLPAVAAGTAPVWNRRSLARAVWRRLGFVAGGDHRRWMTDHLDSLDFDPGALLGPERDDHLPFRSEDGRLVAVPQPVTAESAELIRADYDFSGGTVVGARMDAHDSGRLSGFLKLSAENESSVGTLPPGDQLPTGGRRYSATTAPPPELHLCFDEATSLSFPHAARGSVRPDGQPALSATQDLISLSWGADVRLATTDLTWYPQDALWAESAAARATAEGTYERAPELPDASSRGADVLGVVQLMIMWQLRMMRHAGLLRRWELAAAGALCGGLNAQLFQVRPAALRARWAARRWQAMLATEDSRSRALLRHVGSHLPVDLPDLPGPRPPAPVRITVGTAAQLIDGLDFTDGRLRFVDVTPDETVIHLDARRGGRDTIVVIVLTEPLGRAPLTVSPDGLTLTGRPALEATADDIALTIPLPGGDWTVRAAAGSWYVD